MSLDCVRNGQTNPFEIEEYIKKGVNVYTLEDLHAKVYVFGSKAIVCSANVSQNSSQSLVEVGILCDDKETVSQARGLVKSLEAEPVTPSYLELCKKNYKPPKYRGRQKEKSKYYSQSNLWIVGVWPRESTNNQERSLDEKETIAAETKLANTKSYEASLLRWPGNTDFAENIKIGDWVLQIWNNEKVIPPSRVVHLRRFKSFDTNNRPRIFVYLEEPRPSFRPSLKLATFKELVDASGLKMIGPYSCRVAPKKEKTAQPIRLHVGSTIFPKHKIRIISGEFLNCLAVSMTLTLDCNSYKSTYKTRCIIIQNLEIIGKNTRNHRHPATIEAIKSTITQTTNIFLVEDFVFNLSL